MNLTNRTATANDYVVAKPIRVDYVGVALLTLWAFVRKARSEERLAEVVHGGCPAEFGNGQLEDDLLRSINVTAGEAELFAETLELAMLTFGYDRETLCHAISSKQGKKVAGWRMTEEWEMIRAAKIFYGQLETYGLTFRGRQIRTINVCHYLFTLARLCDLNDEQAKKNPLLRFLYSESELDWLIKHLRVAASFRRFDMLKEKYQEDNGFGRLAVGMLRWLQTMLQADLTLVLARFYRTSPAALAAQRRLEASRVKESALIREADVDTVVSRDDTRVEDSDAPPTFGSMFIAQSRSRAENKKPMEGPDASVIAHQVLTGVDPYDPWAGLDGEGDEIEMNTAKTDDGAWRVEVAGTIRGSKTTRMFSLLRRLTRNPLRRRSKGK